MIAGLEKKLDAGVETVWWTDLVQAEMCLLDATDDGSLVARLHGWRARMHDVVGDTRFAVYLTTAPAYDAPPQQLRADLGECIRTVYYFYSAYGVSARSRSSVTVSAMRAAAVILAFEAVVAALMALVSTSVTRWQIPREILPALELMLATSAVAVLGSVVSVQRRVQDPTADSDPFYRYIQTTADWVGIAIVPPVFGAIFGLVMYGLLGSGLLFGSLIKFTNGIPDGADKVALVLVLGFVAGFAEQLIPDALNRLAARALSTVSATSVGTTGPSGGKGPVVTGIHPPAGPAGTTVTITGLGFSGPGVGVKFGTAPAADAQNQGDTLITAKSPPGAGSVDVTVTTGSGTSLVSDATKYTYS